VVWSRTLSGSGELYEDAGTDLQYQDPIGMAYRIHKFMFTANTSESIVLVAPCSVGNGFAEEPATRSYVVQFLFAPTITKVIINEFPPASWSWYWQGTTLAVSVLEVPYNATFHVQISF